MVTCHCCFESVAAQSSVTRTPRRGGLFTSWKPGGQERDGNGPSPLHGTLHFKGYTHLTSVLQARAKLLCCWSFRALRIRTIAPMHCVLNNG